MRIAGEFGFWVAFFPIGCMIRWYMGQRKIEVLDMPHWKVLEVPGPKNESIQEAIMVSA
jgi:hypothetical protein